MDWKSQLKYINIPCHIRLGAEQFNHQICPKHLNMTFLAKKLLLREEKTQTFSLSILNVLRFVKTLFVQRKEV